MANIILKVLDKVLFLLRLHFLDLFVPSDLISKHIFLSAFGYPFYPFAFSTRGQVYWMGIPINDGEHSFLDTQVSLEPTPVSWLVRWLVGCSVGHNFGFPISGQ